MYYYRVEALAIEHKERMGGTLSDENLGRLQVVYDAMEKIKRYFSKFNTIKDSIYQFFPYPGR
jgi:hypothetical protein